MLHLMSTVSSFVGVHDVPEAVRALTTLAEPDYVDLFTVTTPQATDNSAEEWARAVLEQAPLARRNARLLCQGRLCFKANVREASRR